MSQIVETVHNFLDPQDNLDYFEFGKKLIFDDPNSTDIGRNLK